MKNLNRIRWAVRGVLALGVAASIAGNVLHAHDNVVSRVISAWSPLALLMTIELIARVPVHRRSLALARWAATALIAGIAAWVSYWHMAAVAARYGETGASPYLIPLSVDGLVVVASICLVELGARIRADVRPAVRLAPRFDHDRPIGPEPAQEVAAPAAQIERPRKPHTTNPDRVRRAYERDPDADPGAVARRLNLSLATVKKYRPPKGQPETVNGNVPDLEGAAR